MVNCIICETPNGCKSIEHIVPESFGNIHYVMEKGEICDTCNNLFSKFENKALTNSIFLLERARLATKTKNGKTAKGIIENLKIEGNRNFKKNYVVVKGITPENLKNYDPKTKTGQLYVKAFDKSESAVSKFLLMLGIESLYKSKKDIYDKYSFADLKAYLTNKSNKDWCFISTDKLLDESKSIPTFLDKYRLNQINCKLRFIEKSENTLLFNFMYGGISMTINLLDRNLDWLEETKNSLIHPEHFRKKTNTNKEIS